MEKEYQFYEYPVLDTSQYVSDYNLPSFMTVGEHQCIIPRMPGSKGFMNWDKKTKDQKFFYTEIPTNLKKSIDEEKIVRQEWHRRSHGVWWMLNGQPFYMTGRCYHFMNYWTTTELSRPEFRMEAMEWYWLWDDVYMDVNCFGLLDIKCRRLGDTEKGLHVTYEEMSRFRRTIAGMQHMKRDDAKKNYLRLVNGHKYMQYFFRPQSRGSTAPQSKLEFLYPEQTITAKNAKERDLYEDEQTLPSVGSSCDYEATELRAYDGQRLGVYFGDEYGKINPKEMNQMEQYNVIKQCLSLRNGRHIVGKAYMPTTVEDVASGESIKMMQKFWDYSDPNQLTNKRTKTGLRRIFRGYQLNAEVDEYGFHKIAEAERLRDDEIRSLMAVGDFNGVIELQRKQPRDIHEALQIAATDCTLNPHLLDIQIMAIRKNEIETHIRRGNLEWTEGFGSNVVFVEDHKGKWFITQQPIQRNKRETTEYGTGPGNKFVYSIGGDPIDSKAQHGSRGALAVYRKFHLADEDLKTIKLDVHGTVLNPEDMVTDQFVCVYAHRPDDPEDYFKDSLKTAIYYGAPIFFELQKPYVVNKFRDAGYKSYLALRPKETITNSRDKRAASVQEGAAATGQIISLYVDALKAHISKRFKTYKIMDQLEDFRRFNTDNRGERDISVASGYALLAGMDNRMRREIESLRERWTEMPWTTVKH
jgi:hypothetical protein